TPASPGPLQFGERLTSGSPRDPVLTHQRRLTRKRGTRGQFATGDLLPKCGGDASVVRGGGLSPAALSRSCGVQITRPVPGRALISRSDSNSARARRTVVRETLNSWPRAASEGRASSGAGALAAMRARKASAIW